MEEVRVTRVTGGAASPDGGEVWINVETANGPARLVFSIEEGGKLPIAGMQAVAAAEQANAGRGTFVVQAEGVRMRPDRMSPGLLLVKLLGVARPLMFQMPRKGSDQLYDDLRAIRKGGRIAIPSREQ